METNIPTEEEMKDLYEEKAREASAELVDVEDPECATDLLDRRTTAGTGCKSDPEIEGPGEPDLDRFYEPLHNLVRMVAHGYEEFVLLDAPGGIGKTHNVSRWLTEEVGQENWYYQSGYTTPLELYKTLYAAREEGQILFLDDMAGIAKKNKCLNMLKAATDTQGEENWVSWKSSQAPTDQYGRALPTTFNFGGRIIMSFNHTPDSDDWDALATRAQDYNLDFTYSERIDILKEVAKSPGISNLPYFHRKEAVDWIETVTDPTIEVNIRTLEKVLNTREAYLDGVTSDWERTALEVFDLDYFKFLILQMWESDEYDSVEEQIEEYKEATGFGRSHYYENKNELASNREM